MFFYKYIFIVNSLIFLATVRITDELVKQNLAEFGKYVAECLPKYVQKVQIATGDELEILIAPEGVLPVLQFLKDHHNAQFSNLSDLCAVDIPQRSNRFEVMNYVYLNMVIFKSFHWVFDFLVVHKIKYFLSKLAKATINICNLCC